MHCLSSRREEFRLSAIGPIDPEQLDRLGRPTTLSYLAEVARVAKPELAGMATGGSLFFTFAGILIGLPAFSLIVEKSGSYPLGFGIIAVATFVCGIVLLFFQNFVNVCPGNCVK